MINHRLQSLQLSISPSKSLNKCQTHEQSSANGIIRTAHMYAHTSRSLLMTVYKQRMQSIMLILLQLIYLFSTSCEFKYISPSQNTVGLIGFPAVQPLVPSQKRKEPVPAFVLVWSCNKRINRYLSLLPAQNNSCNSSLFSLLSKSPT